MSRFSQSGLRYCHKTVPSAAEPTCPLYGMNRPNSGAARSPGLTRGDIGLDQRPASRPFCDSKQSLSFATGLSNIIDPTLSTIRTLVASCPPSFTHPMAARIASVAVSALKGLRASTISLGVYISTMNTGVSAATTSCPSCFEFHVLSCFVRVPQLSVA
jgi:hypothetical protein